MHPGIKLPSFHSPCHWFAWRQKWTTQSKVEVEIHFPNGFVWNIMNLRHISTIWMYPTQSPQAKFHIYLVMKSIPSIFPPLECQSWFLKHEWGVHGTLYSCMSQNGIIIVSDFVWVPIVFLLELKNMNLQRLNTNSYC